MPEATKCAKCGSADMIASARLLDNIAAPLRMWVDADPEAILFKGSAHTKVDARICGACGYTELYASNPPALLAAWRNAQQSEKG